MIHCPTCGYPHATDVSACPLCADSWQAWELLFAPLPLGDLRNQVMGWLGQLPEPAVLEWVASPKGLRVRLYCAPDTAEGLLQSWASMTGQHSRWRKLEAVSIQSPALFLKPQNKLPALLTSTPDSDPMLAIGSRLIQAARAGEDAHLRLWIFGKDAALQERLRALSAYTYGTEGGVENDAPNPWGLRLSLLRFGLAVGLLVAGVGVGAWNAGWLKPLPALLAFLAGGSGMLVAALGMAEWMNWRSLPKEMLEQRTREPLMKVAFSLSESLDLPLLSGKGYWLASASSWPTAASHTFPLPAGDLAGLIAPLQLGEGSGLLDRAVWQDVPAPPPSQALLDAGFKIGHSVATGEEIGVDPDGHGLSTGGSRTGKSSFIYSMLRQLVERGEDAPGIFLVDPHLSLADAFLDLVAQLPEKERALAVKRLRVITPDRDQVLPLNLLAVPDFTWAGNAIVQVGMRIWEDYWGPRMQAALLGLFRLAHAWNRHHPDDGLGLLHVVFMAFNVEWRHKALALLPPGERMGALALDSLLGQTGEEGGKWSQRWVTEVISPILSKVMALEMSPWLFSAMHQPRFVDMNRWVDERAWIVLRLPAGQMGREGAKLTAGVIYNVFDAAYRKVTLNKQVPFYFIVDEAQEIGTGMRLEAMLSEGAKFGARMFVMVQSLSMMRKIEGFEPVVQALLANTSTQAFFSPDPEDADLIRATLSSSVRYGNMTLDLPSLQCWLRARVQGRWQPPTLMQVTPIARADQGRVNALIDEVIAAHPDEYFPSGDWQVRAVQVLKEGLPPNLAHLLDELLGARQERQTSFVPQPAQKEKDTRRLGF